jgi:hypothetical protein
VLVLVCGSASVQVEERCREGDHLLLTHVSHRDLRAVAELAGARLSSPMAEGGGVEGWLGSGHAQPLRLLRAQLWSEGFVPELEAREMRSRIESARASQQASWHLLLSAQPAPEPLARAIWLPLIAPEEVLPCAVLIRARSAAAAEDAERALRRCLSRLRNALIASDGSCDGPPPPGECSPSLGSVLPGGGACDVACICALRTRAQSARSAASDADGAHARALQLELAEVTDAFAQALETTLARAIINCGLSPVAALDACADATKRWPALMGDEESSRAADARSLLELMSACAPISDALGRSDASGDGNRRRVFVCDDPLAREAAIRNAVAAIKLVLTADAILDVHA